MAITPFDGRFHLPFISVATGNFPDHTADLSATIRQVWTARY